MHNLLLRLAGKVPDGLLAQSRAWLAEDQVELVARAVAFAAVAQSVPLLGDDVVLLGELLGDYGADPSILSEVETAQYDPAPLFGFRARRSSVDAERRPVAAPLDEVDVAALAGVGEEPGLHGLWRAWRYPLNGSPWPPPRRVYLVEADPDVALVGLTARLQRRLAGVGETDPQVETYPVNAELPAYQRLALAYGVLLWASTPEPDIQIASIFDGFDPQAGPSTGKDRALIDDPEECRRVVGYLNAGQSLLVTTSAMDDVVDRWRRGVVPMNVRTDGVWIWTDATTYYLERYNLRPDRGLLRHIRAADYRMPEVDGVAIHRTTAVLQEPPEGRPLWV